MKNIQTEIASYREAVRHLWNSSFSMLDESLRFGASLELFEQIDGLIFKALVCEPLGLKINVKRGFDPIINLKVVPISSTDVPILINRSTPATGYWDDPLKAIAASDINMALINFFDWDPYKQKDLRYYRVRITDCKSQPSLIGRDALLETFYADVFLQRIDGVRLTAVP